MTNSIILTEPERNDEYCKGCNGSKDIGLVVCWSCFKGGSIPFKYFGGSLTEWLELKKGNTL